MELSVERDRRKRAMWLHDIAVATTGGERLTALLQQLDKAKQ